MWGSYATDNNDGAAVCEHHPSLQQIVWHTNIMGGENSAPPSYATDENDSTAVCKHYSSLQQIVSIPMGGEVATSCATGCFIFSEFVAVLPRHLAAEPQPSFTLLIRFFPFVLAK